MVDGKYRFLDADGINLGPIREPAPTTTWQLLQQQQDPTPPTTTTSQPLQEGWSRWWPGQDFNSTIPQGRCLHGAFIRKTPPSVVHQNGGWAKRNQNAWHTVPPLFSDDGRPRYWLAGCLAGLLADLLACWLAGWLVGLLTVLADLLACLLAGWLTV